MKVYSSYSLGLGVIDPNGVIPDYKVHQNGELPEDAALVIVVDAKGRRHAIDWMRIDHLGAEQSGQACSTRSSAPPARG